MEKELLTKRKKKSTSPDLSTRSTLKSPVAWLQNQLDLAANDRKASAGIILELQAEKKALYDQIERQQALLIDENKKPRTLLMRLKSVFTG